MGKRNKKKDFTQATVNKKDYYIFGGIVLVVLAVFGVIGVAIADPGPEEFAQCLTDKGVKFYGAYWCNNCLEQKKMFGKSIKSIDYIECSLPERSGVTAICEREDIQSYPTWVFPDGTRRTGTQPLAELARMSGCSLE